MTFFLPEKNSSFSRFPICRFFASAHVVLSLPSALISGNSRMMKSTGLRLSSARTVRVASSSSVVPNPTIGRVSFFVIIAALFQSLLWYAWM